MYSVILDFQLEVSLGMGADGADHRGGGAHMNVSAVAADPHLIAHAGKDLGVLYVLQQGAISLLMGLFDGQNALELLGKILVALLVGGLGEARVHLGPLVVLAVGSQIQVGDGVVNLAVMQGLVPKLGVLLLVQGGGGEVRADLLIAVLLGLRGILVIFIAGLRLAGKGCGKVLISFTVFEFHISTSLYMVYIDFTIYFENCNINCSLSANNTGAKQELEASQ